MRLNTGSLLIASGLVAVASSASIAAEEKGEGTSEAVAPAAATEAQHEAADDLALEQVGPDLSSYQVDVSKCAIDGAAGTRRCKPVLGYAVIETKTELSDFRLVVSDKEQFQTFIEPVECPRAKHAPEIEYRLYEGRPFAVLQKVDCFDEESKAGSRPLASYLVVRGLKGFEAVDGTLKIRAKQLTLTRNKAYKALDAHLMSEWPRLGEMIQAERARALQEIEASAFAKEVPAADEPAPTEDNDTNEVADEVHEGGQRDAKQEVRKAPPAADKTVSSARPHSRATRRLHPEIIVVIDVSRP